MKMAKIIKIIGLATYSVVMWLIAALAALNPAWSPDYVTPNVNWLGAFIVFVVCAAIASWLTVRAIQEVCSKNSQIESHESPT